jgi:hypothetical protein
MGKIVVNENISLDGVVEDPTGEERFRHGGLFDQFLDKDREAWAEVEFAEALGEALHLGRRSDEHFGARWSSRRGEWGQVEQPAQVRRVFHPHRSRLGQFDGLKGDVLAIQRSLVSGPAS